MVDQWAYENQVQLHFITPKRPMENGFIESFNGKFRDECLNKNWFIDLADARQKIEEGRCDYNQARPHSALGYRTPEEFAAQAASFNRAELGQEAPHAGPQPPSLLRRKARGAVQNVESLIIRGLKMGSRSRSNFRRLIPRQN